MRGLKEHERFVQKQIKARETPSKPMLDISLLKHKELKTNSSTSDWKEKLEDIPTPKPQVSEITQPKSISESSQTKVEALQPIPSYKKEEKQKEVSPFCKFCGMKLAKMVQFCHQCGTIIKYK